MGFLGDIGKGTMSVLGGTTDALGLTNIQGQKDANEANVKLANQANAWQERMSNTAYQRAMADMGKAGLNPILAYQQGGASVPTAAQGKVEAVGNHALAKTALQAFSGIQTSNAAATNANTAQAQSQSTIALQGAQSAQAVAATEKTQAETQKTIDSIKNQKVRRQLEQSQIPLAKTKESVAKLAEQGTKTISNAFDNVLKNTAKPSVDPKTLQYKKPSPRMADWLFQRKD